MDQSDQDAPRSSSSSRILAIGCGGGTLVLLIGAIALYFAWPTIMAGMVRDYAEQTIARSNLSPEERERVLVTVNRLLDDFESGELDEEEQERLGQAFRDSPLSKYFFILQVKIVYLEPSGLPDERKAEATRLLDRYARGVMEGKISDLDALKNYFTDDSDPPKPRSKLTNSEFEALLTEVETIVTENEIPDEDYEFRIADELDSVVQKALEGGPEEE